MKPMPGQIVHYRLLLRGQLVERPAMIISMCECLETHVDLQIFLNGENDLERIGNPTQHGLKGYTLWMPYVRQEETHDIANTWHWPERNWDETQRSDIC